MQQKLYTLGQFAKYHHISLKSARSWGRYILRTAGIRVGRGGYGVIFIKEEGHRYRYGLPEKLAQRYPELLDEMTIHKIIQEADPTYRPDINYANR